MQATKKVGSKNSKAIETKTDQKKGKEAKTQNVIFRTIY